MSKGIDNILKRSGTGQLQRFLKALDPATFELHDFSLEDWLLFAYNFAENVNYFDIKNDQKPSNNWQNFFKKFNKDQVAINSRTEKSYKKLTEAIQKILKEYQENHELTPHLTLFVCFLQLLEFSKERFNKLTKRHLDFYYKEVLQVDKMAPVSDQVHVLFEIAKRTSEEVLSTGTELNADKDANGNQRVYKTLNEIVVNKAQVASLKTVYNGQKYTDDSKQTLNPFEFKASSVANTKDGWEEPLAEDAPFWYPFGYTSGEENYTELENAEIGFAISSPMLELHEGSRTVTITINFKEEAESIEEFLKIYSPEVLQEIVSIYGSGKEKWIGPLALKIEPTSKIATKETEDEAVEKNKEEEEEALTAALTETELKLVFQLHHDDDALVNYNPEFLLKPYNTKYPLVRFIVDSGNEKGYNFYKYLSKKVVEKIGIHVKVEGATSVIAENDNGLLKTNKPFYPFTPQPLVGSTFSVNYPEAFAKDWKNFEINFSWKDTPENFETWYAAYMASQKTATTKLQYQKDAIGKEGDAEANTAKIINSNDDFIAKKSIFHDAVWKDIEDTTTEDEQDDSVQILFQKIENQEEDSTTIFECTINYQNSGSYGIDASGPVRLTLKQSFLHKMYPRLYAIALMSTDAEMPIPNEPYTPIAQNISISYTAEEEIVIKPHVLSNQKENPIAKENTAVAFQERRIQLFHEHPFGFAEEHTVLKLMRAKKGIRAANESNELNTFLVPKYCKGGQLFVGLEGLEPLQSVSLLIQVLEGSENPLVSSFAPNENVQWSVLCENGWKDLKDHIISNNTENFLSSGIITFSIPREATTTNTLLPDNLIWIKAEIHKTYDAVCKVMNIHTQAVVAKFQNNNNDVSHLAEGLPAATIKKLMTRVPQIKSVAQPYNSFNGIPEESDFDFYRRISERLRHKNRAITLWDYEHLILQKFPEIYKVKCLNHTSEKSFHSPGSVTIITIPDTVNKNVFDIYEPRVSTGTLNKVERYINTLNSMHVTTKVINPNYEQVYVKLEVQFFEGYDKSFYSKKLEEDITKFLSPWAFDDTKEVEFGVTLHKSVLIDYLEKLVYVDYLQNVTISKGETGKPRNSLSPSDPKSILVSAKRHHVSTVISNCKGEQEEPIQECQA